MPEKQITPLMTGWDAFFSSITFLGVGILIGIGQLMASREKLTAQIIIGRALSTGGLAMASGVVLVWVPDLPLIGQIGVAAALASLGTSGIERLLQRFLFGKPAGEG